MRTSVRLLVCCALGASAFLGFGFRSAHSPHPLDAEGSRVRIGPSPVYAAPTENVADCVLFDTETNERGLRYVVSNSCKRRWHCSVTWKLTCSHALQVTEEYPHSVEFSLPIRASHAIDATNADCGESDWRIDHAEWACDR